MSSPVRLTEHAVERYVERVCPALSYGRAFEQLRALTEYKAREAPPEWLDVPAAECVVVSDGIVLIGYETTDNRNRPCWLATTVIVRGTFEHGYRARRNERKAQRKRDLAAKRKQHDQMRRTEAKRAGLPRRDRRETG